METRFFKCNVCGNVLIKVFDSNINPSCCGRYVTELKVNMSDEGKEELHLPVIERVDCSTIKVVISRIEHPMTDKHYIHFVYLETENGGQIKYLSPGKAPEAIFFTTDKPIAVYSYCNLHGLWKTTVSENKEKDCL